MDQALAIGDWLLSLYKQLANHRDNFAHDYGNEHMTSQKCSSCQIAGDDRLERAILRQPHVEGLPDIILCYNVLRCPLCNTWWSRDVNSSRSILFELLADVQHQDRLAYLT